MIEILYKIRIYEWLYTLNLKIHTNITKKEIQLFLLISSIKQISKSNLISA